MKGNFVQSIYRYLKEPRVGYSLELKSWVKRLKVNLMLVLSHGPKSGLEGSRVLKLEHKG